MAGEKTVFKKIIDREIPAELIYEDDLCVAFHDINAQAPVHVLVIPKKEIVSLAHLEAEDAAIVGHLFWVVHQLAEKLELSGGYRTVVNVGPDGGQTVDHLHVHLLGGRRLSWPPG